MAVSRPANAVPSRPAPWRPPGRVLLGRYAARAAAALSRHLRGGSGLVIGGRVLTALAPDAPATLSRGRRILLVSGTNGKTTTTALLADAPRRARRRHQPGGANTAPAWSATLATSRAVVSCWRSTRAGCRGPIRTVTPRCVVLTQPHPGPAVAAPRGRRDGRAWRDGLAGVRSSSQTSTTPTSSGRPCRPEPRSGSRRAQRWTADSLVCPACGGRCRRSGDADWACDTL